MNRNYVAVISLALLAGIALWINFRSSPPQMGADEQVFRTVDALFTAVTARDAKRLGECELRLQGYRHERKLPDEAAEYLDSVIAKARSDEWESAAENLYAFVEGQRREAMQ